MVSFCWFAPDLRLLLNLFLVPNLTCLAIATKEGNTWEDAEDKKCKELVQFQAEKELLTFGLSQCERTPPVSLVGFVLYTTDYHSRVFY